MYVIVKDGSVHPAFAPGVYRVTDQDDCMLELGGRDEWVDHRHPGILVLYDEDLKSIVRAWAKRSGIDWGRLI